MDWISRCTHFAEEQLRKCSIDDWVTAQRRMKWRLAGHLARRTDGRWSEAVLSWRPTRGHRDQGHPRRRWTDGLKRFFVEHVGMEGDLWKLAAQDRQERHALEGDFISKSWF